MKFKILLFLIIAFLSSAIIAKTELIIEPDDGITPILSAIHDTRHEIDLTTYGLTSKPILSELGKKQNSSCLTRVILEKSPYKQEKQNDPAFLFLDQHQIPYKNTLPSIRYIHQKTLVFDGKSAWIMTFNLTSSAFKKQRNFALVSDEKGIVDALFKQFNADWNKNSIKDIPKNILIAPIDARKKISRLIASAKKSLDIYAQDIQDKKMIYQLIQKSKSGVFIRIITNQPRSFDSFNELNHKNIQIEFSKYYIHAKVFIIDKTQAMIGSMNLTQNSLNENRELGIITKDPNILRKLNTTFENDFQERKPKYRSHTQHTHQSSENKPSWLYYLIKIFKYIAHLIK